MIRYALIVLSVLFISACNLTDTEAEADPVPETPAPLPTLDQPTRTPPADAPPVTNPTPTAEIMDAQSTDEPPDNGFDASMVGTLTVRDNYTLEARSGQTLIVNYNVTLTGAAEFVLYVRDEAGVVVDGVVVTQTTADSLEITTVTGGNYEVIVAFDRLPGSYDISFGTR
ncbi:MAG: hypothetical protein EA396_10105 [Anaerolineaceae bacterium]|nr:MAG: hypothetical protein EA396_10105 [Anaerolineaceae bacterium]